MMPRIPPDVIAESIRLRAEVERLRDEISEARERLSHRQQDRAKAVAALLCPWCGNGSPADGSRYCFGCSDEPTD